MKSIPAEQFREMADGRKITFIHTSLRNYRGEAKLIETFDFHGICYSEQKRTITNIMNYLSFNYYFLFNVHLIFFVLSDNKSFCASGKKCEVAQVSPPLLGNPTLPSSTPCAEPGLNSEICHLN